MILGSFPKTYSELREPFAGGGFSLKIDTTARVWINDKNPPLIGLYQAVQESHEWLLAECQKIAPALEGEEVVFSSKGTPYPRRMKEFFERCKWDETIPMPVRYLYMNITGRNGRVIFDPKRTSRNYFSNPDGWNPRQLARIPQMAERLRGVRITCGDFAPLFRSPGRDALIYADPPYMVDTMLSMSAKLYEYGFSLDDHLRLAHEVRKCPHRVCLSYDDHPLIRRMYAGFQIHERAWWYSGENKKMGSELLITNYPVEELAMVG